MIEKSFTLSGVVIISLAALLSSNKTAKAIDESGACQKPAGFIEVLKQVNQVPVLGSINASTGESVYYTIDIKTGKGYEIYAEKTDQKITCFKISKIFSHARLFDINQTYVDRAANIPSDLKSIAMVGCEKSKGCNFLNDYLTDLKDTRKVSPYYQGLFSEKRANTNDQIKRIWTIVGKNEPNNSRGIVLLSALNGQTIPAGGYSTIEYFDDAKDLLSQKTKICDNNTSDERCNSWTPEYLFKN